MISKAKQRYFETKHGEIVRDVIVKKSSDVVILCELGDRRESRLTEPPLGCEPSGPEGRAPFAVTADLEHTAAGKDLSPPRRTGAWLFRPNQSAIRAKRSSYAAAVYPLFKFIITERCCAERRARNAEPRGLRD